MRFELSSRDGWHILRHMEKCLELWVRGGEEVGEGNGERWPSVIYSPRGQITESFGTRPLARDQPQNSNTDGGNVWEAGEPCSLLPALTVTPRLNPVSKALNPCAFVSLPGNVGQRLVSSESDAYLISAPHMPL